MIAQQEAQLNEENKLRDSEKTKFLDSVKKTDANQKITDINVKNLNNVERKVVEKSTEADKLIIEMDNK